MGSFFREGLSFTRDPVEAEDMGDEPQAGEGDVGSAPSTFGTLGNSLRF